MSLLNEVKTANDQPHMLRLVEKLACSTPTLALPRPQTGKEQVVIGFTTQLAYELQDERLPSVSSF